jgi:tRNA(fMet)-specific endonuclease VapC
LTGYLLDTNHIAAALDRGSDMHGRLLRTCRNGTRVGTCAPVLCELAAGIERTARREQNWNYLRILLQQVRLWPIDVVVARSYGELYTQLRSKGRVLSPVDMMVAALARSTDATILTTDRDFEAVDGVVCENWLPR